MRVLDVQPVPLVVRVRDFQSPERGSAVLDGFVEGLAVAYVNERPAGRRLIDWEDLDRLGWSRPQLRDYALESLDRRFEAMAIHGEPPALMLSFGGLESSLLLLDSVWDELSRVVPGDIVVGVPARDVVIVTGTRSPAGLKRVRRAVDRMFLAGQRFPLSPDLLVRRGRYWEKLPVDRRGTCVN